MFALHKLCNEQQNWSAALTQCAQQNNQKFSNYPLTISSHWLSADNKLHVTITQFTTISSHVAQVAILDHSFNFPKWPYLFYLHEYETVNISMSTVLFLFRNCKNYACCLWQIQSDQEIQCSYGHQEEPIRQILRPYQCKTTRVCIGYLWKVFLRVFKT